MSTQLTAGASHRMCTLAVMACGISLFVGARAARAQHPLGIADLHGHVSATLEQRIHVLADSAAAAGLPTSPLIDKTLEGTSKHAPDDRIVAVVQSVLTSLRSARRALGASASVAELTAAVVVLRAGVTPGALASARRQLPGRSLAVPLSVLGSLVAAGVPASAAEAAVVAQAHQTDDGAMLAFGHAVERSIAAGVPPYTAVATATRGSPVPVSTGPATRPKP